MGRVSQLNNQKLNQITNLIGGLAMAGNQMQDNNQQEMGGPMGGFMGAPGMMGGNMGGGFGSSMGRGGMYGGGMGGQAMHRGMTNSQPITTQAEVYNKQGDIYTP